MSKLNTDMPCIAVDCRMLGMSGIGVYLENLVPEVLRRLPAYCFRLIGDSKKIRALSLPAAARIDIRACDAAIYSMCEQARMPLAARGADLLWVPHYNIPFFTPVPLLVTVHDTAHLVLPEVTRSLVRRSYARILFQAVRRKAKTILVVSQFTADEFLRHVGRPRGKISVVHNGVDALWFESNSVSAECASAPYFIAVGNLKAHKRMDILCRAFAAVKDEISQNLVLVGKHEGFISGGQSIQELMALAPGRIICTGAIDAQRLRELVQGASALVFPSSYEGFGLPPLEAMAAGVPVIVADIPPVREVCREHATYFPVDDEQALQKALMDVALCKRKEACLARAVQHSRAFTWEKAADTIAEEIRLLKR